MIHQHHCKRKSVLQPIVFRIFFFSHEVSLFQAACTTSDFQDPNDDITDHPRNTNTKEKNYTVGILFPLENGFKSDNLIPRSHMLKFNIK